MRAVIQRVSQAKVTVDEQMVGKIDRGLLVYLSVGKDDTLEDAKFIADKLVDLRIFEDQAGKMNLSINDVNGNLLIISNFTLHGDCRKGRRPSFDKAAFPELAKQLYEEVVELIRAKQMKVEKGIFAEHMQVSSVNDGPVNFLLDSKRLF